MYDFYDRPASAETDRHGRGHHLEEVDDAEPDLTRGNLKWVVYLDPCSAVSAAAALAAVAVSAFAGRRETS